MANLAGFDASQVPEQQEFSALPEGQYVVIATASEMKPTKSGIGQFLQFTFEVLDGPQKGRKLWARLNLVNPNQTAVDIAQRELGAICRAVNVIKPSDSAELHNKPMLITVAVEIDDRKRESNIIKKYKPVSAGAGAPAAAAPTASGGAPWSSKAAPAAAPTAAAGTPPWAR
ncbi:DUF669 domain-containing protein [Immundisolibacter sp.]